MWGGAQLEVRSRGEQPAATSKQLPQVGRGKVEGPYVKASGVGGASCTTKQ